MGNGNVKSNPYLSVKGAVINLMVPVFIKNKFHVYKMAVLSMWWWGPWGFSPSRKMVRTTQPYGQTTPPCMFSSFKFQVYKFTSLHVFKFTSLQVYKFTSLQVFKFSLHSSVMRFYFYLHRTHCHQRRMAEIKIQTALSPFSISCPRKNLTQPSWF